MVSEKRLKIIELVSMGLTSVEIGRRVELSPRTVEKHLELLRATYGAKNSSHLVGIAFREKLIK